MAIITQVKVVVGGQDVSSRFAPLLEKLTVNKTEKNSAETASITVADPDGIVELPRDGDPIAIWIGSSMAGGAEVFEGTVNDVTSKGGKGSGSQLVIGATSADQKGKVKQQQTRSKDKAKFADVAKEWGSKADLEVQVIGEIASEERDYWSITRESFQSWGQRIAQELGASFRIIGKRAFFAPMNESTSASGKALTPVTVTRGLNLISWSISPTIARPQYGKITSTYFDKKSGEWKTKTETVENVDSKATLTVLNQAANEKRATRSAKGKAAKSKREKGSGTVTIVGNPTAEPGAPCIVVGIKPGIDGQYIIDAVEHDVDKDGFQTTLTIKLPPKSGGGSGSGGGGSSRPSIATQQANAIARDRFATP